ncbi:DUF4224 domain-containing protein [Serratia fonticola]|uniref:DUF4224 domain-containing protein n=1 Tax=Serratia fonticola TaxID=47917 RepID=UPI0021BB4FDC|nr:DUF4224 domain-containing protein [Serratia fonticola]
MEIRDQSMTLITEEEMLEITGSHYPSKQCQILLDNGIPFVKRMDGRPRTTWYNLNHPLSTRHPEPEKKTAVEPNWAAMDEPTSGRKNMPG